MKKILQIIIYSIATLITISCDDYLDVESEKSVTYINYFKNEQEVEQMYIAAVVQEKFSYASYFMSPFDYVGLKTTWADSHIRGYKELSALRYLGSNVKASSWSNVYSTIGLFNTIIDNSYRFENISEERKNFWVAQANFGKGLLYYYIARTWGDAPIIENSETIEPQEKKTAKEVIEEAIRCANKALILPEWEKQYDSNGKPITTKQYGSLGTVHTLLAYSYAWLAGVIENKTEYWEKAEYHASQVIEGHVGNYALEPTISQMLANTLGHKRNSVETIFNIEIRSIDEKWTDGSVVNFSYRYPGHAMINFPYITSDTSDLDNSYRGMKISVDDVKTLYSEKNDSRLKEYWYKIDELKYMAEKWEWDPINSDYTLVKYKKDVEFAFINKWRSPILSIGTGDESQSRPVIAMDGNRVVWRLADLILLRAEVRARLNKTDALYDLNIIRNRAGLSNYNGSKDFEVLRKEIFRERERELYGEGMRRDDIVRNGYYRDELSGKFRTLTEEDVANGALYLPVSPNAFMKNPLMKQNKYWLWQK